MVAAPVLANADVLPQNINDPSRIAATSKSISTPGLHPGTNRRLLSRRPPSTLSATRGRGDRTLGCGRPKSWPDNRLHRGDHRTVEGCKKEVDLVQKLKRETCPLLDLPEKKAGRWSQGITPAITKRCHWVEPVLVAQVNFTEWTQDNQLRQPVFLGLRSNLD
jgi:hypothetical protein